MAYDVVIVGASIAGCTAATLYGRAGLRVALLEKHRSANTYKTLCGHFIQAGAQPTLQRLGLWERMLTQGAAVGHFRAWSPAGWMLPPSEDAPRSISLRRSKLDPLLRQLAAETPGVDLLLGQTAVGLIEHDGQVLGVRTRDLDGAEHEFRGRLTVGADGYKSEVAELAKIPQDSAPNERFLFWAYYTGVVRRMAADNQVWLLEPDVAVALSTDDGLTFLAAFPAKKQLPVFQPDRAAALERFVRRLPDGPDLSGAHRVSKVIGTTDYPSTKRHPTPRRGLALIGDAALNTDPVPAPGCGWAFCSAEWLADTTTPALQGNEKLTRALRRYRKAHRFIQRHDSLNRDEARARPANPLQRALRTAAVHDPEIAQNVYLFVARALPVSGLLNPQVITRSLRIARRAAKTRA